MQAVVRKDKKGNELDFVTMDLPKPKAGQALIKMHAAPINPSDFGFIRGTYGNQALQREPPVVLGFEGSGTVTAVGEGVVDFSAIANASRDTAEWWIVELDRCATDMLQAVEKSYQYITQRGFAHGR